MVNNAHNFCYLRGEVMFARQRKTISVIVQKAYHLYFGWKMVDQDKSWTQHTRCITCATNLWMRLNGKRRAMSFAVPVVCREPSDNTSGRYFCMVSPYSGGFTREKKRTITYPNIPSAVRTAPRGEGHSIPGSSERICHRCRRRRRRRAIIGFCWTEGVYR